MDKYQEQAERLRTMRADRVDVMNCIANSIRQERWSCARTLEEMARGEAGRAREVLEDAARRLMADG